MKVLVFAFVVSAHASTGDFSGYNYYNPTWPSLDTRPAPLWYDQAKFGILMHWGVYSVASIGPESAYLWMYLRNQSTNNTDNENNAVKFMRDNFKPGFEYGDFAPMFTCELFNATKMARIVSESGAKYFVLTTKHHDGYTLWPSKRSWNWNSLDVGPHRDLVGELTVAMRDQGVRVGLYYSLMAWFHPLYLQDKKDMFKSQDYVKDVVMPDLKEIVTNYRPDVLWSDGDKEASDRYWNSTEFIAWLFNESPVKDTVVTNDRWGLGTKCHHGDFYTCTGRYNPGILQKHKWENVMTIDTISWGYRRDADFRDFLPIERLIEELVKTISCGGNLLLNVGPTHYGTIIPIFEERFAQMSQWLKVNGEAVYESKPWIYQNDTAQPSTWYTSKLRRNLNVSPNRLYNPQDKHDTIVYAFLLKWPDDDKLELAAPKTTGDTKVSMLGYNGTIPFNKRDEPPQEGGISIDLSEIRWTKLPNLWAWVFKLEYLETDTREPYMEVPHVRSTPESAASCPRPWTVFDRI